MRKRRKRKIIDLDQKGKGSSGKNPGEPQTGQRQVQKKTIAGKRLGFARENEVKQKRVLGDQQHFSDFQNACTNNGEPLTLK